ncbi:tripartite motif-containing protein 71 [Clonorchis sinensis]|uniref:Tripartite motif-containing protein 71 n=1 Tax=Clonorchis sinensis TaxID=79923 RepID=G7YGU4_CLOSI|nr:tripartite motif-containing protein 71 [Clonorchis sinensis]
MRKKVEAVRQSRNIEQNEVLPSENGFKTTVDLKVTNGPHKNEELLNGNKAACKTKDDNEIVAKKGIPSEQLTDRSLALLPAPNLAESTNGDKVEASASQADTALQIHMDKPSPKLQITETPCEASESNGIVDNCESLSDGETAASGFFTAPKTEDGQISESDTITQCGFEEPTNHDEFLSLLKSDFLGCSVCHDRQTDALELRRTSLLTRTHQDPPTLCMDHNQANQMERDSTDPMALAVVNFTASSEIPQACAYCETCRTILCAACSGQFLGSRMKTTHSKHKVIALDTKVEEIRSQLEHGLNDLAVKKDAFQHYLQCIAEYASDLDSLISEVNNEIDKRSAELHSKIDEIARQLKQIAVDRVEVELGELNKYRDPLDPFIAQCDVAQRYAKALQEYGRPEELIPIAAFVLQRLDYLNNQQFRQIKAKLQPIFHKGEFPLEVTVEEGETNASTKVTEWDRARRYLFGHIQFNQDSSSTISSQRLREDPNKIQNGIPESVGVSCNSVGVNTASESAFDSWINGRMIESSNFKVNQAVCGTNTRTALATQCSIRTKSQTERPRQSRLNTEAEFDSRVVTDTRDVWPTGLALNPSSSHIFVVDRDNAKIKIFSPSGKFLSSFGDSPNEPMKMISPFDVAVTPSGLVLVSDYQLQEMLQPHGISYSPWNNELLVADHANHRIQSCPIQLSSNQGTWLTIPEEAYHRVGYSDGYLNLGSLKPVAEKSTNAVWHPMAIAVDVHHHRIIVSEALGSIKVLKSTRFGEL